MKSLGWAFAGLATGIAGAGVWLAIAHFANMEIGWIAWGIGFLVGVAVRFVAYQSDIDESETLGIYSAAVAAGSIALAKYGLYHMLVVAQGLSAEIPFKSMFSLFDALWFGLACFTAYQVGAGSYGD